MSRMRLLLVDDEKQFLSTGKVLLERRGIDVITCANAIDALEILGRHKIDVIVLDIRMPELDGLDALSIIKHEFPAIEVILLSGHATDDMVEEGLKLGAFDFISKPSRISEIVAKVEEAYASKRAREAPLQANSGM